MNGDAAADCLRLTLDIWHPNCWTLEVTERTPAGLLGHGVYETGDLALGRFTAYGDTGDAIDDLVAATQDSRLTARVTELPHEWSTLGSGPVSGNATRGLLVEYEPTHSMNPPLVSRGFVPDAPVRIHDGREVWTVVTEASRATVWDRLAAVREEMNAEVDVVQITTPETGPATLLRTDDLSERQREVFELARDRGYYEWPRDISAADLAVELGVSKATLLEHLRKAEAKLLGQ
jgi:predicted DNA binding protein